MEIAVSNTGYMCPNCDSRVDWGEKGTLLSKTEPIFVCKGDNDPQYIWDETHKCIKCNTIFLIHNGS